MDFNAVKEWITTLFNTPLVMWGSFIGEIGTFVLVISQPQPQLPPRLILLVLVSQPEPQPQQLKSKIRIIIHKQLFPHPIDCTPFIVFSIS